MCRTLFAVKIVGIGYTTSMAVQEIRVLNRGMRQTDVHMGREAMSRYIDADYVNAFPIRIDHYDEEHGNRHFVLGIESVMEYIEEAPTIDIVHCRECKWAKANGTYQWCGRLDSTAQITADDFCSYGERSSE